MDVPITVTIPVGPYPENKRWLNECIESVKSQSVQPSEILIIDDQAHLRDIQGVRIWKTPWLSGVPHAFNFGVALANNDLVFMLGSDDKLWPDCIKACWDVWQQEKDTRGYYYVGVQYSTGEIQNTPCNAAMVHKDLWKATGGFPIESTIGMCDNMLFQIMVKHGVGSFHKVSESLLYWYRDHSKSDTRRRFNTSMGRLKICQQVKMVISGNWQYPEWT